jgi:ATP-binding cassette, subfamily B, bacterial PglK
MVAEVFGKNVLSRNTVLKNILKLWRIILPVRRTQLPLVMLIMIATSLLEVMSIGAVIPFLAALLEPSILYNNPKFNPVWKYFNITRPIDIIVPMTWMFCSTAVLSTLSRVMLIYVSNKYSFAVSHDISAKIFQATIRQPYLTHTSRNSSDAVNEVTNKANIVTFDIIMPILHLISSSFLVALISFGLFTLNPFVSIISLVVFGTMYALIAFLTKWQMRSISTTNTYETASILKTINESLGAIRDVILDQSYAVYERTFNKHDQALKNSYSKYNLITSCPKPIFESIGMVSIAIVGLVFLTEQGGGSSGAIPMLGAFALAAQRILPAMQQMYVSYSSINIGKQALEDIINTLEKLNIIIEMKKTGDLLQPFSKSIIFKDVNFTYPNSERKILSSVNFEIHSGDRVGIIGTTGSGKSTLVDLLMGLLTPNSGEIRIDGKELVSNNIRSWQRNIAHVPQSIFLVDGSISDNIALSLVAEGIDSERLINALKVSNLSHFIDRRFAGENVGERGAKLSGGERQRVGIARAIYKNSNVLVFDEATSALDTNTERQIIENIYEFNKSITIIMIAHRVSTLKQCNKIIHVDANGKVIQGTYREICE